MTRAFRTAAHHGDYAKVWKVRKHTSWYEQLSTPSVVDLAYSAAFMGHVFYLSALVTFLGTWLMFACLLNPPSLLPFATAILTVLLVSWSIYVSSMKAQNRFRRNFRKALMALIAKRIKHGIHMIKLEENGNAEVVDGIQDDPLCDIDENLTPRDIYNVLDGMKGSRDGSVGREEFNRFLEECGIPLSNDRRESVWVACEENGDGVVSLDEFEQGWNTMVSTFADSELEAIGLSTGAIIASVVGIFIALGLVFVAFLYILAAWTDTTNFSSVIQSLSVAGMGTATAKAKQNRAQSQSDVEAAFLNATIQADASV